MGRKVSIYIADNIARIIGDAAAGADAMPAEKRRVGELSGRIADIIDRYGVLCSLERPALEQVFTEAELNALCDATLSTLWRPAATIIGGVLADFEDSGRDLYQRWGVDPKAVGEKLRGLNVGQQLALAELLERRKRRLAGDGGAARDG